MEDQATYQVLPAASKKGGDLLTDSLGFTYCLRRKPVTTSSATSWRCSRRGKQCLASVTQRWGMFQRGPRPHNHTGDPGVDLRCQARAMVRCTNLYCIVLYCIYCIVGPWAYYIHVASVYITCSLDVLSTSMAQAYIMANAQPNKAGGGGEYAALAAVGWRWDGNLSCSLLIEDAPGRYMTGLIWPSQLVDMAHRTE